MRRLPFTLRPASTASRRRWLAPLLALLVALPPLVLELVVRLGRYPAGLLERAPGGVRLLDREGRPLREACAPGRREPCARGEWRPLAELSPLLREATIAAEDARFHEHRGVDGVAVLRAAARNLWERRIASGASTLTMQLARLLRPHPRTLGGKLGEVVDARRLERLLDKRAILEQYLNRAPYGAGTVGAEAASQRYFGKPCTRLELAEAALLAGLPKAPSELNPLRFPEAALARRRYVLDRLLARGRISELEHRRAVARPLALNAAAERAAPSALHFTDLVLAIHPARTTLRTSLDLELQLDVEGAARAQVRALAGAGATNAAVVVVDNRRCAVRAMVGSVDYWSRAGGAVNGALARRQPGSTLKPFTYALAFERGATPASVVADVETRYGEADGRLFVPRNFAGGTSGPVLMGDALGRSLNIPAVRVARSVGVPALLARLRELGLTSLDREPAHYGLGLTLGNGEVSLFELAGAYAALARGGLACGRLALLEEEPPPPARRVFSETVSYLVGAELSRESVRVAAFGAANALMLGFPVAVKTGTSNDWRDSWVIGYTPEHTVAVWVGNFSGRPMSGVSGASGAGPLFHEVMRRVPRVKPGAPRPPASVAEILVCARSGHRPGPHCRELRSVRVQADRVAGARCDWHRALRVDLRNGLLASERCPARHVAPRVFEVLPPEYAAWQVSHPAAAPPRRYSPLCPAPAGAPARLAVTFPRPGELFLLEPGYAARTQTLELRAEVEGAVGEVAWFVDGARVARSRWPWSASWPLRPGAHTVEAEAGGTRTAPVPFEVR
jgi:penicillin-binding protein 1C